MKAKKRFYAFLNNGADPPLLETEKQFTRRRSDLNQTFLLILILLLGFGLRMYISQDQFLHPWDERYHALVAKNMLTQPFHPVLYKETPLPYDHKEWTGNHTWLHKQPVPLWLMAISLKIVGTTELSIRVPSIFLSTLSIYFTFLLGKFLFNKNTALIAAFLHAINGLLLELCGGRIATDHYDTLFLVFIEGSILFALFSVRSQKKYHLLASGVLCGLALMTKWLPALIVFPVWFAFANNKLNRASLLKDGLLMVFALVVAALPWQIYIHRNFPAEAAWSVQYNIRHFQTVLDQQGGGIFYYLNKIRINYSELIYIPLIWAIWMYFKKERKNSVGVLLWWIILPLFFFSMAATKMQGFIAFTAPALFLLNAFFITELYSFTRRKSGPLKVLCQLLLIASFALPVRYCIERMKFSETHDPNSARWQAMKKLKDINMPDNKKLLIYNVQYPVELMFYVDCIAYSADSLKNTPASQYITVKNPTRSL